MCCQGKHKSRGTKTVSQKATQTFHAHMVVVRWSFYLISKIHVCCTRQPDSGKFTRLLGNKDRERHGDGDMVCWFGGKSASHTQCNNQLTERFHTRNGSNTLNNLLVRVYVRRIIVDRSAGWKVRYCRFSCGEKTLWKFERDAVVGGVQLLRTRSPVWRKWKVYCRTFLWIY